MPREGMPNIHNQGSSTKKESKLRLSSGLIKKAALALAVLFGGNAVANATPKQDGEGVKKKKVVYVHHANDPRLKAYQDSLNLYKLGKVQNEYWGAGRDLENGEFMNDELASSKEPLVDQNPNDKIYHSNQGVTPSDNKRIPNTYGKWVKMNTDMKPIHYRNYDFHYNPDFLKKEYKNRVNYLDAVDHSIYSVPEYTEPTQPVELQKEQVVEDIPPGSATSIESQTGTEMKISKIPFSKERYFTVSRDRQTQELGSKQFGREGLVDIFDRKTGEHLGTYPESYFDADELE